MPKCPICKRNFPSVSSLRDHHRAVHKDQRFELATSHRNGNMVLAVVVVVLVLGGTGIYFALQGYSHELNSNSSATTTRLASIGTLAPSFDSPTASPSGGNFNLSQYVGKSNVLILFNGGLTCSPCLQQMVEMNNDYNTFKSLNVVTVGITGDSQSSLSQWAKINNIASLVVIANQNQKIFAQYGISDVMMSHMFVLIDTSGDIRWMQNYPSMSVQESELISTVNSYLA